MAKLEVKDELLRIAKNAVTMMATVTTLYLLPFLRAVSAPQHCVSAQDLANGNTVSVMKSDPTVVCYAEDDPAYAAQSMPTRWPSWVLGSYYRLE